MFDDCFQIPWFPHYRQSDPEEKNNIIKSLQCLGSQMPVCTSLKYNWDNSMSQKSTSFNHREVKGHMFTNINNFVSTKICDENKTNQNALNLVTNLGAENLKSCSMNSVRQNSLYSNLSGSTMKDSRAKHSNGYSIREILKSTQDEKPIIENLDREEQNIIDMEKPNKFCNNNDLGREKQSKDGASIFRPFQHTSMSNTLPQSAFSIPNRMKMKDNFIQSLPTNSSLAMDYCMGNVHSLLRSDSSHDNYPYASETQGQQIPFDSLGNPTLSPLSGHYEDMSCSPPLSSVSRCHRDRKKFQCPQCRYITDRKNNLMRHIITMHQDSGKVLECCGIAFQSKAALREHNSVFHSGGYRCQICSRNFCRKALLRRHLTVHSGQKDFFCDLCGYATSHKSNLERHQKVHNKRLNRVTLLNSSDVSYSDTRLNASGLSFGDTLDNFNSAFGINTSDTEGTPFDRYKESTNSPTYLNPCSLSNEDYDSDCDVIDVDSIPETVSEPSITFINKQSKDIDKKDNLVPESKRSVTILQQKCSSIRPNKLKRKGFFTCRIQATHNKEPSPSPGVQNPSNTQETEYDITCVLDASETADGEHAITSCSLVNTETYNLTAEHLSLQIKKEDRDIEMEENVQSRVNDVIKSNSKEVYKNSCDWDSPKRFRIYSFSYTCPDCQWEFPNQIMCESHKCNANNELFGIPIVNAVRKGRVKQTSIEI